MQKTKKGKSRFCRDIDEARRVEPPYIKRLHTNYLRRCLASKNSTDCVNEADENILEILRNNEN